jgi:hypothetical protein
MVPTMKERPYLIIWLLIRPRAAYFVSFTPLAAFIHDGNLRMIYKTSSQGSDWRQEVCRRTTGSSSSYLGSE